MSDKTIDMALGPDGSKFRLGEEKGRDVSTIWQLKDETGCERMPGGAVDTDGRPWAIT